MDTQTSHQLLAKIAQVKSAGESMLDKLSPGMIADVEGAAKEQAYHNILKSGLIAGGGAIGFRGAQGLWNLLTRANTPVGPRAGVSPLPVPYPVDDEEEEEEKEEQLKVAQDHIKSSPNDYARWYWPGMIAAAMGGGYGGWKLSDAIFDKRRKEEAEDELESAKSDFQEALTSHYDVPEAKVAAEKTAAKKLGDELDSLFVRFEKSANSSILEAMGTVAKLPGQVIETVMSPEFKERALGGYGVYAVPSVLAGYLAAKHISDKNSERKVLEKAMRRRAAKNYAKRPSELYAIPDPQLAKREDEE